MPEPEEKSVLKWYEVGRTLDFFRISMAFSLLSSPGLLR